MQFHAVLSGAQSRIVTRGEAFCAETSRVRETYAELDFAIAQYVRVRCAPSCVLGEEVRKYAIAILTREVDAMQRNAEFCRDRARVLKVLRGRAIAVVVLFPVAHEKTVHVVALSHESQRRDGGIDAAGEANNDAGGARHARIVRLADLYGLHVRG